MASKPVTKVSRLGLRSIIKARVSHSIFYQIQKNLFVNSGNNFITLFIVYCSVKIVFVLYSIQRIVFYYDVFAAVCLGLNSYLNLSLQNCYTIWSKKKRDIFRIHNRGEWFCSYLLWVKVFKVSFYKISIK